MRTSRRVLIGAVLVAAILVAGWLTARAVLADAFSPGPTDGPLTADSVCPTFKERYPSCEIRFGNSGLSTLNSFYETFVGEGAFQIDGFTVETIADGRFTIIAQSNRGPLRSDITADTLVRLGQDRENETVTRTHQSAFCDGGRIYEHQVGFLAGDLNVQDLEFWTDGNTLRFRLFQNGSPTADVACR